MDSPSDWVRLIQVGINSIPARRRWTAGFGVLLLVGAIVLCYLIERRLTVEPASAISAEWIGTVWDAKLLLMAATLLLSILGWLAVVIYALFRNR